MNCIICIGVGATQRYAFGLPKVQGIVTGSIMSVLLLVPSWVNPLTILAPIQVPHSCHTVIPIHYNHIGYNQTSINPANPITADLQAWPATRCAAPVNCGAPLPVADGDPRVELPVPRGITTVPEGRGIDDNPDGIREIADAGRVAPEDGAAPGVDESLYDGQLLRARVIERTIR